jgi:glycosyltransferase involved in cell wall biosynthesis
VSVEVLYTAAHAGFADSEPLGGAKAVADYLIRNWPGTLTVLSPARFGLGGRLTEMSEWQYARFCRRFEREVTAEILRRDPGACVVLTNDISEGPDFAALGRRGYRMVCVWHVDVVEFFTKFYLRGLVRPETAARWLRWPRVVFGKQRDCVRYAARIVVPSAPMKQVILRCYRWCEAAKVVVLPWGNIAEPAQSAPCPAEGFVIMTLSRLSPEKGIERLLAALPYVRGEYRVWICGAAAYMRGKRYERRLRRMANGRVEFLGHLSGSEKAARLMRADLFVSTSLHESYGLSIAEAQAAGCRVISHGHYGATGEVLDCSDPRALARAINAAIGAGRTVKTNRNPQPSDAAVRLARLVEEVAGYG